ncbi:hypothetical protein BGY98DRAFT_938499, partial [Russula aff. rugulosa BPL654]
KSPYDWNRFFKKYWSRFLRSVPSVKVLRLYVSKPIGILTAISDTKELCATSHTTSSTPILPNLQALHLFRCSTSSTGSPHDGGNDDAASGGDTDANTLGSIFEGEDEQNLVHFLQHRADIGIPIKTIVCTAEDAAVIALDLPEALSLVDTVESGLLPEGIWGESESRGSAHLSNLFSSPHVQQNYTRGHFLAPSLNMLNNGVLYGTNNNTTECITMVLYITTKIRSDCVSVMRASDEEREKCVPPALYQGIYQEDTDPYDHVWKNYVWFNRTRMESVSSTRLDLDITVGPGNPDDIKSILSSALPILVYYTTHGDIADKAL